MSQSDRGEASVALERRRNAAVLLSSVGAGLAGIGLGMMVGSSLIGLKWVILGVGIAVHLAGMVGRRRLQRDQGYQLARWEQAGYWLCWASTAALAAYAATRLA
jgi:hypothetical protein